VKIVEKATMPPAKCALTGDIDGPFIDTGTYCANIDPYIYLHVPIVEQMARELLGMVPAAEVEDLKAKVKELTKKVEVLGKADAAIKELEELADGVAA
jgi:hypothetical protein